MTTDAWLTVAVLVIMFVLLIWDRWPTWAVFGLALTAVITLDLASEEQALSGFSNSGVLTVVLLYIVAAGMYRTGAISMLISRIVGQPQTERDANAKILPLTGLGSAFLNNTPIVAMLIPVIGDLERSARLKVSKIYMAVSSTSILGGAITLVGTSSNLVIAGLVASTLDEELGVFFPARVGLPAAVVGVLFMLFVADRLLPDRSGGATGGENRRRYRAEFFLPEGSHMAGRTVADAGLARPVGAELIEVSRASGESAVVAEDLELEEGDTLALWADMEALPGFWSTIGLLAANPRIATGREYAHRLVEVVVAADSPMVGRVITDADLDERHEKLVGMSRAGEPVSVPLAKAPIVAGDNLVLEVREEFLDEPHEDLFALVKQLHGFRVQRVGRALTASAIVLAMVLSSAFGITSLLNAAMLAVVALLVTGAISFERAFRSIDWRTYVVLAAAVGLEPAISGSGLADVLADRVTDAAGGNEYWALAVVFLGAVVLTGIVTNTAAAAIMFPITLGVTETLDVAWQPYVVVLMMGTSYAFVNPASYQTHLMVYEPGDYRFSDFVRVGIPLTIVLGLVVVPLAALGYSL